MKHPSEFIEVSLNIIQYFQAPLIFDIHVKRAEGSYTKIFRKDDTLDSERVKLYQTKGVEFFYVHVDDYYNYTLYVERLGRVMAQKGLAEASIAPEVIIGEMLNLMMHELTIHTEFDQRLLNVSRHMITNSIQALEQNKSNLFKILKQITDRPYFFKHSMMVSLIAVIVAKANKIESNAMLETIALGALIHDIGKNLLSFNSDEIEKFSDEQRLEYERHPELGKKQLDVIDEISPDVIQIVLQHHECPNGKGFPNNLKTNEIFVPAKMVAIADAFANLIGKKSWREGHTVVDAFAIMKTQTGHYDPEILNNFIKISKG